MWGKGNSPDDQNKLNIIIIENKRGVIKVVTTSQCYLYRLHYTIIGFWPFTSAIASLALLAEYEIFTWQRKFAPTTLRFMGKPPLGQERPCSTVKVHVDPQSQDGLCEGVHLYLSANASL